MYCPIGDVTRASKSAWPASCVLTEEEENECEGYGQVYYHYYSPVKEIGWWTEIGPLGSPCIVTRFGSNDSQVKGLPGNCFD